MPLRATSTSRLATTWNGEQGVKTPLATVGVCGQIVALQRTLSEAGSF